MISDNKATLIGTKADTPVTVSKPVTIFRKESGSAYFKRNARNIPEGRYKIGSGIGSVNRMKSNPDELGVYMPILLGVDRQNPKYNELVDLWFNNISKNVGETGLNLEIGFTYKSESIKESVLESERAIYERFDKAKKTTSKERNVAMDLRDKEIIELEKTKYKYGFPINVEDYILWRYCLVYTDVANDIIIVNKSGHIRFYIYDSSREANKEAIQLETRNEATKIYVKLLEQPERVNNMIWVDRKGVTNVDSLQPVDKYKTLETMSRVEPHEFIKLYNDKDLDIKATIERMIHYDILKRLPNSNVIVDDNNDIVGNSMDEAIIFFKNTERNKPSITRFKAKLKDYNND